MPSMSLDQAELEKIPGVHAYEERSLFTLLHLRDPDARVVFISSRRIEPSIVDYYLSLLPDPEDARRRLRMISLDDGRPLGLADKLLDRSTEAQGRPRATVLGEILDFVNLRRAHIYPFAVTRAEQHLSNRLQIPLLGSSSELAFLGTKAGSRKTFAEARIPFPAGSREVKSARELARSIDRLIADRPEARRLVVKLNEGFSGEGNAILPVGGLRRHIARIERTRASTESKQRARLDAIHRWLEGHLRYQAEGETWSHFSRQIGRLGAIVEEFVEGETKTSPSVQVYVGPDGRVEILSTYEQMLGGRDGQVYLGGQSPADEAYRHRLEAYGKRVGGTLARHGVVGRFAVDFIASKRSTGEWSLSALEINLRLGGTTHPTNAVKTLVNPYGSYDERIGTIRSARDGSPKYYGGTDTIGDPSAGDLLQGKSLKGLSPAYVQEKLAHLKYDRATETGIVLHLMGAVEKHGKVGFTFIGNSRGEAQRLYDEALAVLRDIAH